MSKKATAVTNISLAKATSNGVTIIKTEGNKLFLWVEIAHAVIHGDIKPVQVIKKVKAKTGRTLDKGDFSKAVTVARECDTYNNFRKYFESVKFASLIDAYATVKCKTSGDKANAVRFSEKQIKKAVRAYKASGGRNVAKFMELLGK